ncbi:MAG: thioredoxin domain-containing protein [Terracidiphilus sp.]
MIRTHFLIGLLALGMAAGCKAQPSPQPAGPTLVRHIEVMVRSQYNIPPDYSVALGARAPSTIPGYDALPVTLTRGAKSRVIDFLISTDNKTLARLEKFDLANDPIFSINVAGRPIRGNPAAKVTVINFDDLECPYCAQMHQALFPATLERYKDKVRFIYKDNPLPPEMHPWAMRAAVDANCLAAQSEDAYWAYVDYLHAHRDEINGDSQSLAKSSDALNRIARQLATLNKLDGTRLDACLAGKDESAVRASMKEAESLKIDGVPALFIEGERINGDLPQAQLWMVIDRALRAAGVEPPASPAPAKPVALTPPQSQPAPPAK